MSLPKCASLIVVLGLMLHFVIVVVVVVVVVVRVLECNFICNKVFKKCICICRV